MEYSHGRRFGDEVILFHSASALVCPQMDDVFFLFFSGGSEDWGCYGCGMSFVATRYTTVKLNVAGCAIGLGSPSVSVGDGFW